MTTERLLDESTLALWGLQLRRPQGWWIEVPDTTREHQGQVLLKAPKGVTMAVAWGRLGEARRRFPASGDHMDACLRHLGTIVEASRLVVLYRRPMEVHGHTVEIASVEIVPKGGWLGRALHAVAAVIHCLPRERFYSLYTRPYPVPDQTVEQTFLKVLQDFRCH